VKKRRPMAAFSVSAFGAARRRYSTVAGSSFSGSACDSTIS
jgi:hypothetical protein